MTADVAKASVRRSNTIIGSLMLHLGDADAMLCGLVGRFDNHFEHVKEVIGAAPGARCYATMNALMLDKHTLFIADTFVNEEPSAAELAEIALMAAEEVQRFGTPPKVAFLSHSMYGSSNRASAKRMRAARDLCVQRAPHIECDGEMHGDAALTERGTDGRCRVRLTGGALQLDDRGDLLHTYSLSSNSVGATKAAFMLSPPGRSQARQWSADRGTTS